MDVVYILGNGSRWENNELRYSLRSIEKHLKDFERVFIVGECPDWLQNVTHISCAEFSRQNLFKERNIMEKLKVACSSAEISSSFFSMQDDYFLLKDFSTVDFPNYHRGKLENAIVRRPGTDIYRMTLENTNNALALKDLPTLHFDVHFPIIYGKNSFRLAMAKFDWSVTYGYGVKSLYANSQRLTGPEIQDCKIDRNLAPDEIQKRIYDRLLFSVGDAAINKYMKEIIGDLYSGKSQFEK